MLENSSYLVNYTGKILNVFERIIIYNFLFRLNVFKARVIWDFKRFVCLMK